jgi:16S rRNA (guanine(966)-N(2))-methyltransferase RsmD
MRIISGSHGGRTIHPPKNLPVRPTTDFAKESLFNILNNKIEFEGLKVLDLFCGSGNISYEFLSRGATNVTCVDSSFACCTFVKKTLEAMKFEGGHVIKADVFSFLRNHSTTYDIIFADPPYDLEKLDQIGPLIIEKELLKPEGMMIIEHGPRTDLSAQPHFKEKRVYGNVNFSFFQI